MTAPVTALDILIAARTKIQNPKDWGQGQRLNRENFESCCASEAIEEFGRWSPGHTMALRALRNAIGINDSTLCDWNDAPERTHAEVLAGFDRAIATLRAA